MTYVSYMMGSVLSLTLPMGKPAESVTHYLPVLFVPRKQQWSRLSQSISVAYMENNSYIAYMENNSYIAYMENNSYIAYMENNSYIAYMEIKSYIYLNRSVKFLVFSGELNLLHKAMISSHSGIHAYSYSFFVFCFYFAEHA